tara:strand:- start:727 stop:2790 length:2064 start_codon:yes stop_codon:yes gene_type:complete
MSELFVELFSEEIPAKLQVSARIQLKKIVSNFFIDNQIKFNENFKVFSTPNRLVLHVDKIPNQISIKSEEIRGPNINVPEKALEGFIKSNNISIEKIFKKKTDKGEFFFFKKESQKIKVSKLLEKNFSDLLAKISWNKSMKWAGFDLYWGRPLKSILAIFDKKVLNFNFYHIQSTNKTFLDKSLEENTKNFNDFNSYIKFFKKKGVLIDQELRKKFIQSKIFEITNKRNLKIDQNEALIDEIVNIVEKPSIIICNFNNKFLNIPSEILTTTMQSHQKYLPTFDKKNGLTNNFFVISDIKDAKGLVKIGNERVIEARLSDAEFFWEKNKTQNLVKQVDKLKNINYFKGLGSYFDKIQRMRKISSLISDDFLISKDKIEIASSICKVDLMSDLVGEFPELQGIVGGHFAKFQGFDKEVCLAVSEQYLPNGMESKLPKKIYSIALSLSDKLDSLVGFFGINLKPTSSRDPYAIRRMAISLVRLIVENEIKIKLKDLIMYSCSVFKEQGYDFDEKKIQKELGEFIIERLKNYLKEKQIRQDIIESSTFSLSLDDLLKAYKKSLCLNKNIKNEIGSATIAVYKRSSSILNSEGKISIETLGFADPGLFKNDYEKKLYKKINDIRKYYLSVGKDENYEESLLILSSIKNDVNDFFDNVIVNDEDIIIKKNRLELLNMLCKTFDNYFNFSRIEA